MLSQKRQLTSKLLSIGQIVSRRHSSPSDLDRKSPKYSALVHVITLELADLHYVKQHEVQGKSPCFHAKDIGFRREVVDHPTHDHIRKSVGQKRCYL